jgi:hypothetical protein
MLRLVLSLVAAELESAPTPPRKKRRGLWTDSELARACDGAAGEVMQNDSPPVSGANHGQRR